MALGMSTNSLSSMAAAGANGLGSTAGIAASNGPSLEALTQAYSGIQQYAGNVSVFFVKFHLCFFLLNVLIILSSFKVESCSSFTLLKFFFIAAFPNAFSQANLQQTSSPAGKQIEGLRVIKIFRFCFKMSVA